MTDLTPGRTRQTDAVTPHAVHCLRLLSVVLLVLPMAAAELRAGEAHEAVARRMFDSVKYLASDAMEGRDAGTQGIDMAADYIAQQFDEIGLRTKLFDGTPFQKFDLRPISKLGPPEKNRLELTSKDAKSGEPRSTALELDKTFTPLSLGISGTFDAPMVFVGYGITASDLKYDDYAGIDAKGKVAVMLRKEPQQGDDGSKFSGRRPSRHATFAVKVANASNHGAVAVMIVNDEFSLRQRTEMQTRNWRKAAADLTSAVKEFAGQLSPSPEELSKAQSRLADLANRAGQLEAALSVEQDALIPYQAGGAADAKNAIPVFFCSRRTIQPAIKESLGVSLSEIEQRLDQGPTPHSRDLTGWKASGQMQIDRTQLTVKNVVGVLDGIGPLADETIVVGAHYDHVGYGRRRGEKQVHNGADDNASGTTAIIEVARRLAARRPESRRRVVFIAFAAEERGLLGSAHYAAHPLFPNDRTKAMLNLDMVGRLSENRLIIGGTGTAKEFDSILADVNESYQLEIKKLPSGFGPSDHASFYGKEIPVLFFFTGLHPDYHQPSDDPERINVEGMVRVTQFVTDLATRLDESPETLTFQQTPRARFSRKIDRPPFLGVTADALDSEQGFRVATVMGGSPAAQAGIEAGDLITKIGESAVSNLDSTFTALRKNKPGDTVKVTVRRGSDERRVTVKLGQPR